MWVIECCENLSLFTKRRRMKSCHTGFTSLFLLCFEQIIARELHNCAHAARPISYRSIGAEAAPDHRILSLTTTRVPISLLQKVLPDVLGTAYCNSTIRRRVGAQCRSRTPLTRSDFDLPVKDRERPGRFLQLVASVPGSLPMMCVTLIHHCQLPIANYQLKSNRQSAIGNEMTNCWIGLAACINYFFAFLHEARPWRSASDV